MLSKPTLIISVLLLAASVGLFYFLMIPNFEEIETQNGEIEELEISLKNTTNYFDEINQNATKLEELDWDDLETKIDANFMSGPFYEYNMNIFIEKLVAESNLELEDLSIAGNSLTGENSSSENGGEELGMSSSSMILSEESVSMSTQDLEKVTLSLGLVGEYDDLKAFLESLSDQFCVIDINKISIEPSSGSSSSSYSGEEMEGSQSVRGGGSMKFLLEGNIYSAK
jgi:Tfp pilus assembly protein PilO